MRAPWWPESDIANELSDRGTDPMLRTYLWSYPAGADWFINLVDNADPAITAAVLQLAYQHPLTPHDLSDLWPAGHQIGGPGHRGNAEGRHTATSVWTPTHGV